MKRNLDEKSGLAKGQPVIEVVTSMPDSKRSLLDESRVPPDEWLDDEEIDVPRQPVLRFRPTAWAKLLYFRDKSEDEVGGFGITEAEDLLLVTEFVTVKQEVSCVSVKFDDEAVGRFFDEQVDLGRKPEQFARVWLHTHPGDSPAPSGTDEGTFERVFGACQSAAMCIVARKASCQPSGLPDARQR